MGASRIRHSLRPLMISRVVRLNNSDAACREIADSCFSVIPGWCEAPDPESRDSGFIAARCPGMTTIVTGSLKFKSEGASQIRRRPRYGSGTRNSLLIAALLAIPGSAKRGLSMKKLILCVAVALALTSVAAKAAERAGDAALGALSGAVVLGPIGAVAGAVVGYTAGPHIARSWGFDRRGSTRQRRQASKESVRGARAEAIESRPAKNPRVATSRNEAS